jgi:hypothetical protein
VTSDTVDQHVVLGPQLLELAAQVVEQGVHLVAKTMFRGAHDALDVGYDDLAVEPGKDRDEIVSHVPDPTPGSVTMGPESR